MGQSGSVPLVTSTYTNPLHLRLHFQYDPATSELYQKPRPFTTAQVKTLVSRDWPAFFNKSISFGGGSDSPERYYKSDEMVNGRTCLYLPPKRIHLKSSDIREVREVTGQNQTVRRFCIDVVTQLIKNTPKPVQTYVDKVYRNTYIVRVGPSYPLDKLIKEAFMTVEHQWMGGGWLQAVDRKRSAAGRGDIYPDTTKGASSWYEYVPHTTPRKTTRKHNAVRKTSAVRTQTSSHKKTSTNPKKAKPTGHIIRFTGFRDPHLAATLEAKGHTVTDNMSKRVTDVVWNGKQRSRTVREAESRSDVRLWTQEEILRLAA